MGNALVASVTLTCRADQHRAPQAAALLQGRRRGVSPSLSPVVVLFFDYNDVLYNRGAVLARLRAIAQDERIPFLDRTPPMREATGALSWPYYDFDSHWNRLGHKIAGEQVDVFLRRQGWDCAR